VDLEELLDYWPVPPRRVVTISGQYQHLGRGRSLPYELEEDGESANGRFPDRNSDL
jgi:hypothetical protein